VEEAPVAELGGQSARRNWYRADTQSDVQSCTRGARRLRLCAGVRSGTATRQRACASCAPRPIAATNGSVPPCQEMTLPLYDNANLEEVAAHLTAASLREREVDPEWAARPTSTCSTPANRARAA
jgi:hypothetical protein